MTTPEAGRILIVLLTEYGPVCAQCLADHTRMTVSAMSALIDSFRQTIAVREEHGACLMCGQVAQIFSLGAPSRS